MLHPIRTRTPLDASTDPRRGRWRRPAISALLGLLFVWQIAVTKLFARLVRPEPGHLVQGASAQEAGIALVAVLGAWAVGSIGIIAIIFWLGKTGARAKAG